MCFQLLLSLLQGRLDEKVSTSRFPGSSVPSGSDLSSFQKCLGSAFFARRGGWKPSCCLCWSEQGRWFDRVVRNYWGGASKRELECHDSVLGNQKQEQEGLMPRFRAICQLFMPSSSSSLSSASSFIIRWDIDNREKVTSGRLVYIVFSITDFRITYEWALSVITPLPTK